jgi:hypothetical protein
MTGTLNARNQRLCVICGPLLMVVFTIAFWFVAGMIPPPPPGTPVAELAAFYSDNQTRIRIGLVIAMLGAGLAMPFPVAVMLQMKRIEGATSLAYVQLIGGLFNTPLFVLPWFAMAAATYRPMNRVPEVTQALSDLGWLTLVGFGAPAIFQTIVIGIAVFSDHRPEPVYPRWFGYFNIWCALLFMPGLLVICFHDGPFAYNGIFAFWVPLAVFSLWFVLTAYVTFGAIRQEERQDLAAAGAPAAQVPA